MKDLKSTVMQIAMKLETLNGLERWFDSGTRSIPELGQNYGATFGGGQSAAWNHEQAPARLAYCKGLRERHLKEKANTLAVKQELVTELTALLRTLEERERAKKGAFQFSVPTSIKETKEWATKALAYVGGVERRIQASMEFLVKVMRMLEMEVNKAPALPSKAAPGGPTVAPAPPEKRRKRRGINSEATVDKNGMMFNKELRLPKEPNYKKY